MREQLHFRLLCLTRAWKGSWSVANALGAFVGGSIISALSWTLGLNMDAPTSVQGTVTFAFVLTVVSIFAVWPLIFAVRCWSAPAKLYSEALTKIDELEDALAGRPNIRLEALNEVFNETRQISNDRPMSPEAYEIWKKRIDEHVKWIQEALRGTISDTEINLLLNGPSGPRLSFRGSFGSEESDLRNYLHNLEHRIGQLVERHATA